MNRALTLVTLAFVFTLGLSSSASAQTRTFVSGVGSDSNPCSRTAPCKTFAGAISKTAAKGEIDALDPAGYGVVTITKSITIAGDGTLAGILNAGTNGIIVNAAVTDNVIIRNISLAGAGTGTNGIRYLAGKSLTLDNVSINGNTSKGVDVSLSAAGTLIVRNSTIVGGTGGIKINTSVGRVDAVISNSKIQNAGIGIEALSGFTEVNDCVISGNTVVGARASNSAALDLMNNRLTGNGIAVEANNTSTVRVASNDVFNNQDGFVCNNTPTLATDGNNRKGGNSGGVAAACTPTGNITNQ